MAISATLLLDLGVYETHFLPFSYLGSLAERRLRFETRICFNLGSFEHCLMNFYFLSIILIVKV